MFAPSRVRGLKPMDEWGGDLKFVRTFTGAWIETSENPSPALAPTFAPSRVRGLKLNIFDCNSSDFRSHLHGCVD